ncbi:RNA polymerase sigma factor [Gluconacetobacter sacchari]|uniref:RNA polymerase sigma factor n=1 Tax=Gluconacetobacter sacchari TaxID=92759 RepID=UPI0022305664|nr:RNA polymerase sigma factor [Gluconacetobacter sacchari]
MEPLEKAGSVASLYAAHQRALLHYAGRLVRDRSTAEDIVQEAWLRFAHAAVDARPIDPMRYLYRIIRNLSIDNGRHAAREQELFEPESYGEWSAAATDGAVATERLVGDRAALDIVKTVMDAMPERMRIAFEMHRLGGCKLREIATTLGISLPMAHVLVSEAVARCREQVEWP